jgi:uridine kinase
MDRGTRDELLRGLAEAVGAIKIAHPTRVAIDGVPAAGKTTLADEPAVVLDPLGPGGDRRFQHAVYDKVADIALSPPVTTAPADAVLVFDGVFLLRPELMDRWELRIFVSAPFEKTVDRAQARDQTPFRSAAEVERRYRSRYIPSQLLYFDKDRPADHADIIVHNDEPRQPAWWARAP